MKEFKLPSGAVLQVTLAPFKDAKDLYQACLEEALPVKFDDTQDLNINVIKDVLAIGLSSKKIEEALWVCMGRATYNKLKITNDTFESEESRTDYMEVCFYVLKVNILPFVKDLYAKYAPLLLELMKSSRA